jgi:Tfp pilus assembly protein PilN
MKVRLNLATTPLENHRPFLVAAVLVGVMSLTALVWLGRQSYRDWRESRELRAERSDLEAKLNTLQQQRRELEQFFNRPETRRITEQAAYLNTLIAQRSFSWTQLFMDLERLLPAGVRVISIAPQLVEGRVEVRLVIGATSDEAKLKFLQTLDEANEFERYHLLTETRPRSGRDTDQVQVELVAWYVSRVP